MLVRGAQPWENGGGSPEKRSSHESQKGHQAGTQEAGQKEGQNQEEVTPTRHSRRDPGTLAGVFFVAREKTLHR
jgi:hypothetical protein